MAALVLYKRRWLVLAVFSLMSMTNEVIWISLSSITSIVKKYYNVSSVAINWLSMIYMLLYVFVLVSAYVLDKQGLKFTIVFGAVLNGIGSCMRLIGCDRDGFILAFIGNAFAAMAQCFILFVPPTLAAVWFGDSERATASAIGVLMNMLGVAVGFLMGGTMVPSSEDYDGAVKDGMFNTLFAQAVFCTIMVLLCVCLIKDAPQTPPSMSQMVVAKRDGEKTNQPIENDFMLKERTLQENEKIDVVQRQAFWPSLITLSKNISFHLIFQAYGLYFGLFAAYNTILNQMCMVYFPGKEKEIGLMGFVSVLLGLVGILLAGLFIDKTKRYKLISVVTFICCSLSFLTFTLVLKYSGNFVAVFGCFCVFGFFSYPYLTIGLEHAAEVTYPILEGTTSGLLLLLGNMYGIVLTYIFGAIIDHERSDLAGFVISGCYMLGFVFVALNNGSLERLKVDRSILNA